MTKQRDSTIDIMKFLLISMMVWFHIGGSTFIHIFNMPVFFMISGIFLKEVESFSEFRTFAWKKVIALYLPYILTNLGFLLFHNLFVKLNFYTNNPEIFAYFPDFKLYDYYAPKDFIKRIILVIATVGGTQLGGATWFLRALFFSSILFGLFDLIFSKLNITQKTYAHLAVGTVLLVVSFILRNSELLFLERNVLIWIRQCIVPYIFFPLGKVLYSKREILLRRSLSVISCVVSLLILVLLCNFRIHIINEDIVYNPLLFLIGSISGFIFVFSISSFISKFKVKSILSLFGQNTLYVLSLHLLVFKFVNLIFVNLKNLPVFLIASFPSCYGLCENVQDKIMYGGGYEILGVFVPIFIGMIMKKIKLQLKRR